MTRSTTTRLQQWSALAATAVLAVLALGWVLLVGPERTAAAELRATAQEQQQANARAETALSVLKAQFAELPRQRERLAEITRRIPADPQQPGLLRALRNASSRAGVQLLNVEPSAPVSAAPAVPGAAAPSSASASAPALQTMTVATRVSGSCVDVEQYVALLEKSGRALRVTSVQVEPGEEPAAGRPRTPGTPLVANVTAEAYVAELGDRSTAAGASASSSAVPPVVSGGPPGAAPSGADPS